METMPRLRPPHLTREIRSAKVYWYFRRDKGPRIPLPGAFGSPEFSAAYDAALSGNPAPTGRKEGAGTLGWLIDRYMGSTAWAGLSQATRRQRNGILAKVKAAAGHAPLAAVTRQKIIEGRDARERPAAARHFVETVRAMFQWALDAQLVEADPTRDVKVPKKSTEGHHTWTPEEVALFEARWPLGTRQRLAFDLMQFTGLRRSDAVVAGRQHVRDGVLTLRTKKTGQQVSITILPELAVSLAAGPCGDLAFIVGEKGKPMTSEGFGNWFRKVCRETGLPHCSAHGIRKRVATTMAENGASVAQMESVMGWRGGGMASLYTRKADRVRLAKEAMRFLSPTRLGNPPTEKENKQKQALKDAK